MSSSTSHSDSLIPETPTVSPMRELFNIAWPTVLTMTSYTAMQFVDAAMVGRLGPVQLAGQGNGGLITFVPLSFLMGVLTMVNTYTSQNLGAGRPREAPRYAWMALWMSLVVWLLMLPYGMSLRAMFTLAGHSPELIGYEVTYGRILVWGCFLTMMSRGISHFFYGLHRPKVIFIATVAGNLTNIFGNWVLIFGHLGAPAMGIGGAAIATVIGTAIEFVIPLMVFLGPKMNAELGTRSAWRPHMDTVRDLWRVGWPRSLTFGNEMVCWAIFMTYLIGTFGETHNTAGWIVLRYMHLSFMPAVGISVAITALVGRYIGAGQPDVANQRAWLGVRMAMYYMGSCALMFVIFRHPLASVLIKKDDPATPEILAIASQLLICAAVFQCFDAMAISLSGALSGAGDTVWTGIVTMISSWTFIVGGGFALVYWAPQLKSLGPWIGASAYIILLGLAFVWRWRSGYWRTIKLLKHAEDADAVVVDVDPASGPLADRVLTSIAPTDEEGDIEPEPVAVGAP